MHPSSAAPARLLVLRPNAVGDFVFALPALHALRLAYPQAHITLLGRQWHADFLRNRPGPLDEVIVMPPLPGTQATAEVADAVLADGARDAMAGFMAMLRAARYDVALQMYGGGRHSNPFIAALGAGLTAGLKAPDAPPLDRWIAWSPLANRRLELLQVAALAGATVQRHGAELAVTDDDRALAALAVPAAPGQDLAVLHPGASDARRRWSPAHYAAVGDALAGRGVQVAISATADEATLASQIVRDMRHPAIDLSGRLSLPALCGLLERAQMIIANDTGPLHLAMAIGTPAVGIFWLTNLIESGPLRPHLLRPALSLRVHCPVCGMENVRQRCPHDVSFVDDVGSDEVIDLAFGLLDLPRAACAHETS